MTGATVALLVLRAATILVGAAFLVVTSQAYRKHRSRALLVLGVAIALMVLGAGVELVAYLVFGASLGTAEVLEASVTLLAFLVLLASVNLQRK